MRKPDLERITRELFFWLRPDFLLRCLRRFQALEGFDRALALASSAFTATIPLLILIAALLPAGQGSSAAEHLIERYGLTSAGAQAVRDAFAPAKGVQTSLGVLSALLLLLTVLGFARAVQRLIERAWELKPLSVRNTRNAAVWILGLVVYSGLAGLLTRIGGSLVAGAVAIVMHAALGASFLLWTGRLLSARRVGVRALIPFAVLVGVGLAVYAVVSPLWVPELFSSYASRYGVIGATFAMISALFGAAFVIVVMTAIGREADDELGRIRRGERPPRDAVRREWEKIIADARGQRDAWLASRRRGRSDDPPER